MAANVEQIEGKEYIKQVDKYRWYVSIKKY